MPDSVQRLPEKPVAPREIDFKRRSDYLDAVKTYKQELDTYRLLSGAVAGQIGATTAAQGRQTSLATQRAEDLAKYQNSPLGLAMTLGKQYPALMVGGALGAGSAAGINKAIETAAGRKTISPLVSSLMLPLYAGATGLGLYKNREFSEQANQPTNTPFQTDVGQMYANAALGSALGTGTLGSAYSLGSLARGMSRPTAASDAVPAPPVPTATTSATETPLPVETPGAPRYTGKHLDIVPEIARDFGLKPGKSKSETTKLLLDHLPKADVDTMRDVATKAPSSVDETATPRVLRNQLKDWITAIGSKGGRIASYLGPIAAVGAGAYALTHPTESEAGGLPTEGPGPEESLTQYRLRNLGLPSTPEALKETALDIAPVTGQWRLGSALGEAARGLYDYATRPGSVMGESGDARLARFRNWLKDQRSAESLAAAKNSYAAAQAVPPGAMQEHALAP